MGVRVEVVMEEDCTMIVMNMPMMMLRYPLCRGSSIN